MFREACEGVTKDGGLLLAWQWAAIGFLVGVACGLGGMFAVVLLALNCSLGV